MLNRALRLLGLLERVRSGAQWLGRLLRRVGALCSDEPEERRVVFAVVEEVGEVECHKGEVVCCIDAGIYVS